MPRIYLPSSEPVEEQPTEESTEPTTGGPVEVTEPVTPGPTTPPPPPAVPEPARNGSKADWVAYAVSKGADQAEAEALSRDELVAKYGTPPA